MTDKIRLGLIGASVTGRWSSESHLPALAAIPDFALAGVCTTRAETAEAARAAWNAGRAYSDWREMVTAPDIDAVSVVVKVPAHFEPAKAALEAGKAVYCEWPLGRTTEEAAALAALAAEKGLATAVGLQAHVNPALLHMKALLESGYVGRIMTVHLRMMRDGILSRPSHRVWQRDVAMGANPLTIPNGHTLYGLQMVLGPFDSLSAVLSTQATEWTATDTGEVFSVSAPDNILISGRLKNGAAISSHVATIPHHGSGFRLEVYGDAGTLVAVGGNSPQRAALDLVGAQGDADMAPIEVPESLKTVAPGTPAGAPYHVGRMYAAFARAIRGEDDGAPGFATALEMHRLLDAIRAASDTGRAVHL